MCAAVERGPKLLENQHKLCMYSLSFSYLKKNSKYGTTRMDRSSVIKLGMTQRSQLTQLTSIKRKNKTQITRFIK
jgi:hypothetical protein